MGKLETVADFIFLGSKITVDGDCSHEIKRHLLLVRKLMTRLDNIVKRRDITLTINVHRSKAMVFFSSDKNGWALKNWCFQIMVLEKTLDIPLDSKEIKPINPKGNQPWLFIGRTDAGAEAPILCPPNLKNWLIEKNPEEELRWQRNRTGRPLSPPQIHRKNIWMLSKLHKTTSERWQRTSGTQESSPLSSKGSRTKYKR